MALKPRHRRGILCCAMGLKTNPSLLQLLEQGAHVEFPDETWLKGDPQTRYIEVGYAGCGDGRWSMDKDGLENAMLHRERLYADQRGDDFTDITGDKGYVGGIGIMSLRDIMNELPSYTRQVGARVVKMTIKKVQNYNIINEDYGWLDGAPTRAEIRRKYLARLERP